MCCCAQSLLQAAPEYRMAQRLGACATSGITWPDWRKPSATTGVTPSDRPHSVCLSYLVPLRADGSLDQGRPSYRFGIWFRSSDLSDGRPGGMEDDSTVAH